MSDFSDYLEYRLLEHALGISSWTSPGTVYVGLHTSDPGESGFTGEISDPNYARQAVSWAAVTGSGSGQSTTENDTQITWQQAGQDWGSGNPITHISIADASSSGNQLLSAQLSNSKVIESGDRAVIDIGDLTVGAD